MRLRDQRGFTIIELMAAISILAIALLSMAYTSTVAFKYAGTARQKTQANSLANQAIQQVRGLSFGVTSKGLVAADVPNGDSGITTGASCPGGSGNCVKVPGTANCYETIVATNSGLTSGATPLYPHRQTRTIGGSTYTTTTYVTNQGSKTGTCGTSVTNGYRVLVTTSWTNPVTQGVSNAISLQTTIANTSGGCLSSATHPFSGPCQASLYSQAVIPQGTITVKPYPGSTNVGTGVNGQFAQAQLMLPLETSSIQSEQVSQVQGAQRSSGVSLTVGSATASSYGLQFLASQADSDLALPDVPYQQKIFGQGTVSADTTGTLTAGASGSSRIVVNKPSGSADSMNAGSPPTGSSTSTTDAAANPGCGGQVDAYPCSYSKSLLTQSGTAEDACGKTFSVNMSLCVGLQLYNGATFLGNCPLVVVGAPAAASTALADRAVGSGTPGVATATISRVFPQVTVGCLPSVLISNGSIPAGWIGSRPAAYISPTPGWGFIAAIQNGYTENLQSLAGLNGTSATAPTYATATMGYWAGLSTAVGTLNTAMDAVTTTLKINAPSGGPYGAGVYLKVDNENMVTSAAGACVVGPPRVCTYTVTRHVENSAAATHSVTGVNVYGGTYASVAHTVVTAPGYSMAAGGFGLDYTVPSVAPVGAGCRFQETTLTSITSGPGTETHTPGTSPFTSSTASFGAPLTGSYRFQVGCGGSANNIADLEIDVALGSLNATGTYAPAAT